LLTVLAKMANQDTQTSETRAGIPLKKYTLLLNLGLAVMIPLVTGLMIMKYRSGDHEINIESHRTLPAACAPGLAFPVVLRVRSGEETPLLVQENVPANMEILASFPDSPRRSDNTLKWFYPDASEQQMNGYLVAKAAGKYGTRFTFTDSVTVRRDKQQKAFTEGGNTLILKPIHWADTNADYRIDENELLAVYEDFEGVPELKPTLDNIEKIRQGSGYHWNQSSKTLEILP